MKLVFMGTPDFAAGVLTALHEAGHVISAVVTQPDKAKGRSKELVYSPVKEYALQHGIPVLQPKRIKTPEAVEELRKYEADVFVVAAFGQLLSQEILDMPPFGCLNVHASLLPKYRGASPIQHVILNGEEKTGVTIQQMAAGLDTGDMLYKREIPVERQDTFVTLHDKLMEEGGKAMVEALLLLSQGKLVPEKQQEEESSYFSKIEKSMGEIDFRRDALTIERKVRGLNPWPSAYTYYKGKQLKIWEAEASEIPEIPEISGISEASEPEKQKALPGTIIEVGKDVLSVATGKGVLRIKSLQLEGRKRMSVRDFLLGVNMQPGEVLSGK